MVAKSCRALAFITCDARVVDGSDVFDVPCVETTKVLFTLRFDPTLTTICVGLDVYSTIEGLEVDTCWRPQYKHGTIGESKTSLAGKTRATMEVHQIFFRDSSIWGVQIYLKN